MLIHPGTDSDDVVAQSDSCCAVACIDNMTTRFVPAVWLGVLFIRQGLYQEGVFRFSLIIPDNYPDGDCPVGSSFLLLL